jgi:hypothetical protein
MFMNLLYQIEVFLFIMAIFVMIISALHVISVFRLKSGKIVSSTNGLVLFGVSLAYIITILITGFA